MVNAALWDDPLDQGRLPQNEDYVFLGESFSGPIAYNRT